MALEDSVNNLVTQTTNLLNTVNVAKSTLDTAVATASVSATAAAASYDQFDDRYLGAKSANPSLDNDSNALIEGAIYWNTTAKEFRVWNGSAWQADALVGGTVANLNTTGSLQEAGVDVVVQSDIGTDPNQVPLNQYLGDLAYQNSDTLNQIGVNGVKFLGTASTDANTLDDYEEGTWTPVFVAYDGTVTVDGATYVKIGQLVTAFFIVTFDGTVDSSQITVSTGSLPFTILSDNSFSAQITFNSATGGGNPTKAQRAFTSSVVVQNETGGSVNYTSMGTGKLGMMFTYRTA